MSEIIFNPWADNCIKKWNAVLAALVAAGLEPDEDDCAMNAAEDFDLIDWVGAIEIKVGPGALADDVRIAVRNFINARWE